MALAKDGMLFRNWTAWYLIPDRFTTRDANWRDFLHEIGPFETVEGFWALYNSLEKSAMLPKGCRHYVFKTGIRPLWEDRFNTNGFEISVEIPQLKAKRPKITNNFTDCILALIGESVANSDVINGVEFRVRTDTFMISYWVAQCDEEVRQKIAQDLEKISKWNVKATITPIVVHSA